MRKYIIRQSDAEDSDTPIEEGESAFWMIDDKDLVPKGYALDVVQNTPKLKIIYVHKEEKLCT